jgi:hypothetical protein
MVRENPEWCGQAEYVHRLVVSQVQDTMRPVGQQLVAVVKSAQR